MVNPMLAAAVMASVEVNPGRPSDLTGIISSPELRRALLESIEPDSPNPLLDYLRDAVPHSRRRTWEKSVHDLADRLSGYAVLAGDPEYPRSLADCWDAPPLLFIRGHLSPDHMPTVAVVGSRDATDETLQDTHELAAALANTGSCVVSGLAAGVDTAAHTGALAAGGRTTAVLGTGVDRIFPETNTRLAGDIAATGALVSQFAPGAPHTRSTFLMRNHVIAGLSRTSIVMASAERSGSRHEAMTAADYGRQLLFWAPSLKSLGWARCMVDKGAARFIASIDEAVAAT